MKDNKVSVNGEYSKWTAVSSGIPQGSVLEPILFVIYINDLPDIVNSEMYFFADDTNIFTRK
jgi:ribonuclease P/MRP protein subunit RPP40